MRSAAENLRRANSLRPSISNIGVPMKRTLHGADNAAMIGCQGYYEYQAGHTAGLDLNAYTTRDISPG